MNLEAIRIQLIRKGLRLKDVAQATGIDYDRLVKVVHAYRPARSEEISAIASAIGLPESSLTSGKRTR